MDSTPIDYKRVSFDQRAPWQRPADDGCGIALPGAPAGKSSAINTLTRNKGLARTSKTPGHPAD